MTRLVLAALLWGTPAFADGHPRVELVVDPCVESRDEIQRIVQIELGDLLATEHDPSLARTHVGVACDGTAILLHVDDPANRSLSQSVDLARSAPPVRARLIGLAIVELVASSWTEPPPAAPPMPEAPRVATPREAPSPSTPSLSQTRITAAAGAIRFSNLDVLAGGDVRVSDNAQRLLGWMVDAELHRGSQVVDRGAITTQVIDVGAAAQVHRAWPQARGDAGVGLRGGVVQMSGAASDLGLMSSSFSARWLGAFATGHVGIAIAKRVTLDALFEAGEVLSPVTGLVDGKRAVAVDGAWLAGHVGIGVSL